MKADADRILFPDNPWPGGHRIATFAWTGELDPDRGAIFHIHLESVDYDARDPDRESRPSVPPLVDEWISKDAWRHHHSCILSSWFYGDHGGILVGTAEHPFDLDALDGRELVVDPLPLTKGVAPA